MLAHNKTQNGFTLIEVLITIIVLTIGILGMLGLQTTGLNYTQSGYYRSQASIIVGDIVDRMRANPGGVEINAYDDFNTGISSIPNDPNCIETAAGCDRDQLAQYDLREWARFFENIEDDSNFISLLPGSTGIITREDDDSHTITITWQEIDWDNESTSKQSFSSKSVSMNVDILIPWD